MFSAIFQFKLLFTEELVPQIFFMVFGLVNIISPYNCDTDKLDKLNCYSMFIIFITGLLAIWSRKPSCIMLNIYLTATASIIYIISNIIQAVNISNRVECVIQQLELDTFNDTLKKFIGTTSSTPDKIQSDLISRSVTLSIGVLLTSAFSMKIQFEYKKQIVEGWKSQQTVVASSNSTDVTLRANSQPLQQ